ncbi:MAG TPA: hypothetical protein VKR80_05740 [Candidatus Limnocylindria bacterium]|nr:hypothetical protein [Candidatus Limnocylindria bacterium]
MSAARRLAALVGALLLFRVASAVFVVFQPGYTDAYYYVDVAKRLAAGQGLTADFVWNFLEYPVTGGDLPIASHRFWMPLATALQAVGIKGLAFLDPFHAAQSAEILVACAIPLVGYLAARSLGASANTSLVAAALAGLGGAFAPGWVSLDAFAPAAVIGTAFFLCYRRAAQGDVRYGVAAGLAVGLLFLARAEAALFGLPLLLLVRPRATRRAGLAATAVALAIGLGWLARDLALGPGPDLLARSALLVRYEDFFAVDSSAGIMDLPAVSWDQFTFALPTVLGAKLAALGVNATTFLFAFGLLLVPGIARSTWALRSRIDVRAYAGLAVLVYLVESLVFTLHSTRGSYFHALAAFFPFGVALGVIGTAELLRTAAGRRLAATVGVAGAAIVSSFALSQWDSSFNAPYRERVAIASQIPAGRFMAIDAAAWRWIADRPVVVTPTNLDACAIGRAADLGVTALVLERAHFTSYDPLYRGGTPPDFLGAPSTLGDARLYPLDARAAERSCRARL